MLVWSRLATFEQASNSCGRLVDLEHVDLTTPLGIEMSGHALMCRLCENG